MRGIGPRRSGPKWQKSLGNRLRTRNANDDRHPSVDASWTLLPEEAQRITATEEYCQGAEWWLLRRPASGSVSYWKGWPYAGLSRMKGNFHVRFLEGGGLATARLYSATR